MKWKWTDLGNWKIKDLRGWSVWKLKLVDARLYFVSLIVGLLTGAVTVPYHYLLQLFFDLRKDFMNSHPRWYIHIPVFLGLWGVLLFVAWMVKKMPFITGGGIPQTRGVINGRICYKHPFIELIAKFTGGVLALSSGLSLGREGPSVQIGSYIGSLVSRWTRILPGEQKQLLSAGAGAGLAAAFSAPLASSLLVIESIERFDAPKTAITTLLAGVVAGSIASMAFPISPYFQINAVAPELPFEMQVKIYLLLAAAVSLFGKIYSQVTLFFKRLYPQIKQPVYVKLCCLLVMAYAISLTEVNLTGGGEQFLLMQAMGGSREIWWVVGMLLLHFIFTVFSFASGLPGGSFIPTLVTGGLFGQIFALILIGQGIIGPESISYVMLVSMVAFLIAVVRTPLTAIVLIIEITGHFEVFYPSVVVGGLTYYFTELLQIKPFNVVLYEEMLRSPALAEEKRCMLAVEIMTGSYFDGKQLDTLTLPEHCVVLSIHRDRKDLPPAGQTLIPGDQMRIELDAGDVERLYEPLVSMANIY